METVPHVVLEYGKWSDCALVALTDDAHSAVRDGTDMPYLVTSGYHRGSRTWARATPFGDITRAKVVFEHRVDRDYAPNEGRLHDDEVIACRWRRGDIAGVLEESLDYPIPATKENIDTAIGQIAHVQDRLIEDGWREIVDSIREERLDLGLGSSQADNFYRGVYDVTAHHNSMFWPSGDGSAVHVSHCRLGDGPSFGLTVRTIPAAAIGNETVTFEKIDRLGGKIELCVDSIDQDIEKVRAFASSSPAVRAFVEPLCAYIPAPSDSVGEQKRDISPYLRQTARRCQRISHPIDPPETASAARRPCRHIAGISTNNQRRTPASAALSVRRPNMNDKLDHFVLEYDDASGNALLAMTEGDGSLIADGAGLPYALARGYDANARTWESIEPFDDVTRAKLHYEKACGREYVPTGGKLYDDEFITLRWRRQDIADSLESDFGHFGVPIPATDENIERALNQLGNHIDDAIYEAGWDVIHDRLDVRSFDLGVGHSKQAKEFYEQVFECDGDFYPTVNVWPAVDGSGVHVSVCPVTFAERDLAVYKVDAGKIGDGPITIPDLDDIGTREVHVDDFTEKPEEVRLFLRTDGDVYLFGSSLGKSLAVEDADEEDIAYALREVRTYCKDATEKRDPQLICAKAQAAAAKSATAEGDAGGKKL